MWPIHILYHIIIVATIESSRTTGNHEIFLNQTCNNWTGATILDFAWALTVIEAGTADAMLKDRPLQETLRQFSNNRSYILDYFYYLKTSLQIASSLFNPIIQLISKDTSQCLT